MSIKDLTDRERKAIECFAGACACDVHTYGKNMADEQIVVDFLRAALAAVAKGEGKRG